MLAYLGARLLQCTKSRQNIAVCCSNSLPTLLYYPPPYKLWKTVQRRARAVLLSNISALATATLTPTARAAWQSVPVRSGQVYGSVGTSVTSALVMR